MFKPPVKVTVFKENVEVPLSEREPDVTAIAEFEILKVLLFNDKVPPDKLKFPFMIYMLLPREILELPSMVKSLNLLLGHADRFKVPVEVLSKTNDELESPIIEAVPDNAPEMVAVLASKIKLVLSTQLFTEKVIGVVFVGFKLKPLVAESEKVPPTTISVNTE